MLPGARRSRTAQACETCRRKKTRCPGGRPSCGLCARLGQFCEYRIEKASYSKQTQRDIQPRSRPPQRKTTDAWIQRVDASSIEDQNTRRGEHDLSESHSPPSLAENDLIFESFGSPVMLTEMAILYDRCCNGQPLTLFRPESLVEEIHCMTRELKLLIVASAVLHSAEAQLKLCAATISHKLTMEARRLLDSHLLEGAIEVSTLQSLCLIILKDYDEGNIVRAKLNLSTLLTLSQCAGLHDPTVRYCSQTDADQCSRLYWNIVLLGHIFGVRTDSICQSSRKLPDYPISPLPPSSQGSTNAISRSESRNDGIFASIVQLSEAWVSALSVTRARNNSATTEPPWSLHSDYTKALSRLMDIGPSSPQCHRYKYVNPTDRTTEELEQHRSYWAPWFLSKFMYNTTICILNHPLPLSIRLHDVRKIPEIFIQQSTNLLCRHADWTVHLIDIINTASFQITDPLIAYCAVIIATVELYLSFTSEGSVYNERREAYAKCVEFAGKIAKPYPNLLGLLECLEDLDRLITACLDAGNDPNTAGPTLDVSLFWRIIEYGSASFTTTNSLQSVFGPSLLRSSTTKNAQQLSTLPPMPKTTRFDPIHNGPHDSNILDLDLQMDQPGEMQDCDFSLGSSQHEIPIFGDFDIPVSTLFRFSTGETLDTWNNMDF